MTLKTTRDLVLPSVPEKDEGIKDAERVLRWRKAHLQALRDQHEDIYDDLRGITDGSIDLSLYAKLAGRSGGQTLYGGVNAGENLNLKTTSHATKGKIYFGTKSVYDEVRDIVAVGTTTPSSGFGSFTGIPKLQVHVGDNNGGILLRANANHFCGIWLADSGSAAEKWEVASWYNSFYGNYFTISDRIYGIDRIIISSSGGSWAPPGVMCYVADADLTSDWLNAQFRIQGTDPIQNLVFGYDTTNLRSVIQGVRSGETTGHDLYLNPYFGSVFIGTNALTDLPTSTLNVGGKCQFFGPRISIGDGAAWPYIDSFNSGNPGIWLSSGGESTTLLELTDDNEFGILHNSAWGLKIDEDGMLKFGFYTARGSEQFVGYITIRDLYGNTRKLMVCE